MLNVKFEFQRMGVPSHLYLHTQFGDDNFTAYDELQYSQFQDTRFFKWLHSIYPNDVVEGSQHYRKFTLDDTDKNTSLDHHHKIKIQQELFSFSKIGEYLEKDLNILGCKFSVLCQNLSGMHSYKYVYFCPDLSTVDCTLGDTSLTIKTVRNWAIPEESNKELFDTKKKNKLYLRISLFNTPVIPTVSVENFKVCEDIGGFTDGCGYISPQLAKDITEYIKKYLMEHYSVQSGHCSESDQYNKDLLDTSLSNTTFQSLPDDYVPSAFQIRFLGAKGMLCVKEGLFEKEGCHLVLQESMVKVVHDKDTSDEILHKIQVVGYSSPSGNAHLTLTLVHLFNGCSDDSGIIQKKIMESMHDSVNTVIESHLQSSISDIVKNQVKNNDFASLGVLSSTKDKKMAFLTGCYRTNLMEMKFPLKNTRRLYGVADPYGILDEGQVYINITSNNKSMILNQEIVITKEPCLHRGDLRKVKAVNIDKLSHLTDVIVFPTKSKDNRPIPNTIAGSDLDGDEYFVCWDEDIVGHCIQFTPALSDDLIEKQKFEKYTSFEPDAFKYWIGIRMAFADYFDKEWTSEENWNSTMSILCDVLNSAVDAPKQGSIVTKKEQLQNIITNFPGFPHYMNKASGGTRHSTSLIGKMFDEMNNKITKVLGYIDINVPSSLDIPLLDNRLTTTTLDCQKYLWMLFFHFCKVESLLNDYRNFTDFMCTIIREGKANILLASEFLSTFWRGIGISFNDGTDEPELYYCFLKEKITNLPEFVVEKLCTIISKQSSKVFFSNGLLCDVAIEMKDPSSSNYFQSIMDNNLCELFKISNDYPSSFRRSIILKDCMQRLRIPPTMFERRRLIFGGIHPSDYDMLTFIDFTESNNCEDDTDMLPRFNFFELCGFGYKEKEFRETKADKFFNAISSYITKNTFDNIDSLRIEIGTPFQCQEYHKHLRGNNTSDYFLFSNGKTENIYYQEQKQHEFFNVLTTNGYLTKIERLILQHQQINDTVLGIIVDCPYLNNVTYLDISENLITDEGIVKICGKMPNLEEINLSANNITYRGITTLLTCNNFPVLTNVRFSNNDLSKSSTFDRNQSDETLTPHTVSSLTLDNCCIDMSLIIDLAPVIFSPNLTRLYLSHNNIGDIGATCIAQSSSLFNLQNLHIDNNNITNEGAIAITDSPFLQNLTYLNIRSNYLSDDGIIAFVTNILPSLKYLDLGLPRELLYLFEGYPFKCL